MDALDRAKYELVPIGVTRQGRWIVGDALRALEAGDPEAARLAAILPDPEAAGVMEITLRDRQPGTFAEIARLDVVIPVLHGTFGEDGTVQGLLELAGIPYVGAGVVGSAVGMDKAIFKQVMSAAGLPVLPWRLVRGSEWRDAPEAVLDAIEADFEYPLFTKPANLGSSVGISRCDSRAALAAGMDTAARYDRRIVVEQGAEIRELEVSVLGNDEPVASVVGEIRPRRDFYDYVAKYVSDDSELLIPAPLEEEVAEQVRALALRAYRAIDCAGLARVDLMLERGTGRLYMNEINTMPGFTRISMYPKLWEASGLPYGKLLDRLIELALERHAEKSKLTTAFTVESGSGEEL
jgi:D-alanine-D-alanine ligase